MNVRISGVGDSLVGGASRPMTHLLNPYARAAARPCGAILAGVFASNDLRVERKLVESLPVERSRMELLRPEPRFSVGTGLMLHGEPSP
jgi:hypothetical protein